MKTLSRFAAAGCVTRATTRSPRASSATASAASRCDALTPGFVSVDVAATSLPSRITAAAAARRTSEQDARVRQQLDLLLHLGSARL